MAALETCKDDIKAWQKVLRDLIRIKDGRIRLLQRRIQWMKEHK